MATSVESLYTGQQALDALLPLGFVIERETDQIRIGKGALKLTLPKRDEYCNPVLNGHVNGIVRDLKEKAINAGTMKREVGVPLMVLFDEKAYAVVENRNAQWQLQDLEDGHRFTVNKSSCKVFEPEPEEKITVPELKVHPAPPPPEESVVPPEEVRPLTNPSSVAALARMTQQRLEAVKIEMEQALNRYNKAKEEFDITSAFLRTLGVEVDAPPVPFMETKRTILPPVGPGKPTKSSTGAYSVTTVPTSFKDRVRMAWIDLGKPTGYGYMQKVKDRLAAQGVENPYADTVMYAVMKELKGP